MSVANFIVGAVQAQANTSGLGTSGMVLVYIGAAVLFGLIGLVPLLADKPAIDPAPQWTVVDSTATGRADAGERLGNAGITIDGEVKEVRQQPRLAGQDRRWGR